MLRKQEKLEPEREQSAPVSVPAVALLLRARQTALTAPFALRGRS
jgi:hypothetical protein